MKESEFIGTESIIEGGQDGGVWPTVIGGGGANVKPLDGD